jgi:hypothetical protein
MRLMQLVCTAFTWMLHNADAFVFMQHMPT